MQRQIGGWIRSSGNSNVTPFKSSATLQNLAASNNSNEYVIPNSVPIYDQGQYQDCIANAVCGAFSILQNRQTNTIVNYSRLFLYWNLRVPTHSTNLDEGGFISVAFDSLKTLGICPENTWGYNQSIFSQPPLEAYNEGNSNTITDFYEITSQMDQRIADCELAIRASHPIVFGATIGTDYERYNGDSSTVFGPPSDSLGGHAQCLIGVRINASGQREFCVRNSWGSLWGQNGCSWISSDYLTWDQTSDLFVATQMQNLLL